MDLVSELYLIQHFGPLGKYSERNWNLVSLFSEARGLSFGQACADPHWGGTRGPYPTP